MKDREQTIAFEMNYCQHYRRGKGSDMTCGAGMDLKTTQIAHVDGGMRWGPCIGGHTLDDPLSHCRHWLRRTREMGEKRADKMQRSMDILTKAMPVISTWRTKPKPSHDKQEVIKCPACDGRLHLRQSAYNGHVWAKCETSDCVGFIE